MNVIAEDMMTRGGALISLAVAMAVLPLVAVDELPDEAGRRPAISPSPFPDRMSAYVWRNWGMLETKRLADVVGATVEDLAAVAVDMGLRPDPTVQPEWKRKGYITVLRRNWHLLPYEQLLVLLDMTREDLRFRLMEDDFLWVKLGCLKPKCEALKWDREEFEKGRRARRRISAALKEENIDPNAEEEPRFAFIKDISSVDPCTSVRELSDSDSPFDFRLISSYFADYGDPLWDEEVGSFPEGLLQKLSAQGVNAVWLHAVLRTLVKDPKYPEFGEGCERRLANLQKLVDRCAKYGIRVFLYMNEPRGLAPSFFKVPGRDGLGGARCGVLQAMCTLHPETQRWLSDSLERVFSTVQGLGGIFSITASENLTNCATRPGDKDTCPVCRFHSRAEIIAAANNAMIRGMRKGNPKAEAIIYNWSWPTDEEESIVNLLPTEGVRLMAVSERGMEVCRGGIKVKEADYSISIVGPGENAKRLWRFAKNRGIPTVAKVQAANSWELSSFPYLPTMDLVAQHASNLANEEVDGVMLSWSLGCCPSPNLRVYNAFRCGEKDKEGALDRLARELYGDKAQQARLAWRAFSDGFENYPFACGSIYCGPHQWGPANPLYLKPTGYRATMVGIPYDNLEDWRTCYPGETYVELMSSVAEGFDRGCRLMAGVADSRELNMFRAEQMHFASCSDQARFIIAREKGDFDGMRCSAKRELERAKEYWPLVRADSRIGYESSNHYFFTPRDVVEKILSCRSVIEACEGRTSFEEDPKAYWKMDELAKVPACRPSPFPDSDFKGLKAMLVSGRGLGGAEAEFFCYYGVPKGPRPAAGWPGVVLVHGEGGTADPRHVRRWTDLGFAVIAPDWYNQRPAPGIANVVPNDGGVPCVPLEGGKRQDHVANVANMVLAHSLLRSFDEVNACQTVFVGLSWGSWYGACVAAVDARFKGCVEIYCGDKDIYKDPLSYAGFANGRFLHAAKIPMWWAVSTNDRNVTPDTSNAGFSACGNFAGVTIVNDLPHSHCGFEFEAVRRMARHFAGLAKPLPRLGQVKLVGRRVSAKIENVGEGIAFGRLAYTKSFDSDSWKCEWKYAEATVEDGEIRAELPEGTARCYLAAYEKESPLHDMCGTTVFITPREIQAWE